MLYASNCYCNITSAGHQPLCCFPCKQAAVIAASRDYIDASLTVTKVPLAEAQVSLQWLFQKQPKLYKKCDWAFAAVK